MSGFDGRDSIPRVTVRWPRQIGGPRHGEPRAPDPSPEVIHYVTLPDGSFAPGSGVPRLPRAVDTLVYVEHRIPFGVNRRIVEVKVQAWSELTTGEVGWLLLTEALGVPEALR